MNWIQITMIVLSCVALGAAIVFFIPKGPEYRWLDVSMFGIFTLMALSATILAILHHEGVIADDVEPKAVPTRMLRVQERGTFAMGRHVLPVLVSHTRSTR